MMSRKFYFQHVLILTLNSVKPKSFKELAMYALFGRVR